MRNRTRKDIFGATMMVPWAESPNACRQAIGRRMASRFAGIAKHWRRWLGVLFVAVAPVCIASAQAQEDREAAVVAIVHKAMAKYDLRAVIIRVMIDGRPIITQAFGESVTGVPATTDMHFRNGNIAFAYVTTLLLQLAEEKQISLDDKLSKWIADLPSADRITLRMLASMTSGYADYVRDEQFVRAIYADPFRQWTPKELISIGVNRPLLFEPGTNFGYSHTGYVILGQVIEKVTGKPLAEVMRDRIFAPLGLLGTAAPATAEIASPVLHAFTSERRGALGIAPSVRFYEESTYWNPSWATAPGAVQTTNIYDAITSAVAVGTGVLLSPDSHQEQIVPHPNGFGSPTASCPLCRKLDQKQNYGLGVFLQGPWIVQAPLLAGYSAVAGYLPSKRVAIGLAVTFGEKSFDGDGAYVGNIGHELFNEIGAYLVPDAPP
jgi:CubicO group peptidase (beta-lactamase class C family)